MTSFKFVIADKGKCYQIEKSQNECEAIIGLKIGSKFDGSIIGLNGYKLEIRGGTDKDGFPMRPDIEGIRKKRILIAKSIGFRGKKKIKKKSVKIKGFRKRKTVRGNTIGRHIVQINCKIVKYGEKPIEDILKKQ